MSQQINLFNPIFLKQKKYFSAAKMAQALALLVLGALVLYVYAVFETRGLDKSLAEADQRLKERREQVAKFVREFPPRGQSKLVEDELARADARLKSRREMLVGITTGVSGNAEGYSGLMTAFARQATNGVWLTGFSVGAASELTIKGRVLDAELLPTYLQALKREDTIRGRGVAELKLSAKDGGGAAAKAAAAPGPKMIEAATPTRFVEFSVILEPRAPAPLGAAAPAEDSRKGTP